MDHPYAVLGLSPDADRDAVRAAYRSLLKECHPDQGGSTEAFLRLKRAYETIQHHSSPSSTTPSTAATTDGGATTRRQNANWRLSTDDGIPEHTDTTTVSCTSGPGHALDGDALRVTLVGLADDADLTRVTWSMGESTPNRPVVSFVVENVSDRSLTWRGSQSTTFLGADETEYDPSTTYRAADTVLPGDWTGPPLELDPGEQARTVVVCEALPEAVGLDRIVYTQSVIREATGTRVPAERFVFDVDANTLAEVPKRPF